jgi:Flp pilus assembly protein TadG
MRHSNSRDLRVKRRGHAVLEFTLIGIPLMFVLISIFEIARGMWVYHTMAYAIKEGTRYTIVRGQNNPTPATYQSVCNAIVLAGSGLLKEQLSITFTSQGATNTYTANACPNTPWPSGIGNRPGQLIMIVGSYPFQSAIAMFWPGAGRGMQFPAVTMSAISQEVMQF